MKLHLWTIPALCAFWIGAQMGAGAESAPKETPPAPGPAKSLRLERPAERELGNGLRVIVVPRRTVPLVVARLIFKAGSEADPPGKAGVAQLTADLLNQKTETRDATQVARRVESLGATVAGTAGWDGSNVWAAAMTPQFREAFALLGEVVRQPAFDEFELEGMRVQWLTTMEASFTDPSALSGMAASRLLFGEGLYGAPASGTPESMGRIRRIDLMGFHHSHYRPENGVLIMGGDIAPEEAFALAERVFGDWNPPAASRYRPALSDAPAGRGRSAPVVVIDQPQAGQAAITLAWRGPERSHPDLYVAMVADAVLSGVKGRLMEELRMKRGLVYGAASTFSPRRRSGQILVSTLADPAKVAETTALLLDTVRGLGKAPVPEEVLKTRKMAVIGAYARTTESIEGLINQASLFAAYDMPLQEIERFIPNVEAVTAEQVREFAARCFSEDPVIVIAGNAKLFQDSLKAQYPRLRVVPLKQLDLDRADLLKSE